MFVRVDSQRNPLLPNVALEAVHRRNRAFIRIEPGIHQTARIVDVGHQHAARPAPLEPVMVRAIQLNECPYVSFLHSPHPVRLFARLIGAIRSHFVRVIVCFMNTIIVYQWAVQSASSH